ncbi:MAG: V-type ATP synthase subunit A [Deltaproteobacteria bacterium]|uniref:V-type ATP synthase alpha chain n=1 Tax=Candidatus Zymogenus saltonus TaxID=2844893 RepID=A0A9D8KBT6_9DELT|nr:V-type ATP synthase subunit A [Candidatus Zymogenus saltonus]
MMENKVGAVIWISGPVVKARVEKEIDMMEMVMVGEDRISGEVIELERDVATIQVYEETTGLKPGAEVFGTGLPLSVELGPGLISNIYDGVQRPLETILKSTGDFIERGVQVSPLSRELKWKFTPTVSAGDDLKGGAVLGTVPEGFVITHKVLLHPNISGKVKKIVPEGEYTLDDVICEIETKKGVEEVKMYHRWPVRVGRPYAGRLAPSIPLITGQRIIDTFFPIAKGGTAAIPGGFGTGKTVTQHNLAKWSDADIIVYIGCGERGNEMTGVLVDFPELEDPRTGKPLMERTILIANTSNMPVAAREASIYTGITLAEFYRDMGYDVAIMADSTSRWAEALREISGRLEEMPAEEGFPAYLATRLAEFYERSGRVETLGGGTGSVSAIGAVSPPGGDFSEPVTQHTKRFVRCFWGLDKELASARFYPAINYMESYSEYMDEVETWWRENGDRDWKIMRNEAMEILRQDDKLQQIVRLVGEDALPDEQKLVVDGAKLIKNAFLQQSAFDDIDMYCMPKKQIKMMALIMHFYRRAQIIINQGVPIYKIRELPILNELNRMKGKIENDKIEDFEKILKQVDEEFDTLIS